ncbi:uncharacterized protein B0I36DRAFT_434854 [Microdochium trichocladiopsis]|uniref:Uncharacterized protein n=1 Tax=Microdochium trichocladiopsis TaxID=1682393 RepID=A0A9P9BNJ0_9PEZI|nr:uncharacterized protein B0I36DRAFT_434854 [Microdochium trichocladiopsis]KAH7020908.1 hypothetical protein B0I36DRAFT_434854 [Microdochium trichocladiopsis]
MCLARVPLVDRPPPVRLVDTPLPSKQGCTEQQLALQINHTTEGLCPARTKASPRVLGNADNPDPYRAQDDRAIALLVPRKMVGNPQSPGDHRPGDRALGMHLTTIGSGIQEPITLRHHFTKSSDAHIPATRHNSLDPSPTGGFRVVPLVAAQSLSQYVCPIDQNTPFRWLFPKPDFLCNTPSQTVANASLRDDLICILRSGARHESRPLAEHEPARHRPFCAEPQQQEDSDFSMPSFRPFKKGKKPAEEKPQIDLATVLPSNDDFRTSLLMSGLSARFSMLREQDDPNTKIGKASDDSVLFSNRQSRLDFGLSSGLGDIAEVESIKPPYARNDSFHSDDADSLAGGSIMGRSKPTEGNNLFGGRQKIYKIPAGANASKTDGGMPGRALYDDDVAMSAFQKWRMQERERKSIDGESDENADEPANDYNGDGARPASPGLAGYNKNRDTSSTTSSIPSMARNSTAATSIMSSQRTPSFKEGQNSLSLNTSTSTPATERNVARTRRLYEQALNQDLQENQSSALSRFESLSKQRGLGSRTPDLAPGISPSPTLSAFSDRFGGRSVLAKASAPNLRSMSPPATASTVGTPDLNNRVSGASESRSLFGGGAPPLSPPISESGDASVLAIQPNDRGKATAMGVFQKPSQPYDESRFAQRQVQLQQGRETPTLTRDRTNSNASRGTSRSTSAQRPPLESKASSSAISQMPLHEEQSTFFVDDGASEYSVKSPETDSAPTLTRRPSDRQHPALRESTSPVPLTFSESQSAEQAAADKLVVPGEKAEPLDSPTLPGAGLSGMVRQHLRAASNASSVYDTAPGMAESDAEGDSYSASREHDGQWTDDFSREDYGHLPIDADRSFLTGTDLDDAATDSLPRESLERDEFATQLADGARRIRERLTMYADSDSRSTSPHHQGEPKTSIDAGPAPRATGLGILRSRESRGSMRDRGRDESQSKAMRMLGLGSRGSSPAGNKYSLDASPPLQGVRQTEEPDEPRPSQDSAKPASKEEHAGIRAFRQARRELQRMKELEAQGRRQAPSQESHGSPDRDAQDKGPQDVGARQSPPSRDRRPPPMALSQRMPSGEAYHPGSNPGSRSASRNDRDRSGSDSSQGYRSQSRQGRFRNDSDADRNLPPRLDIQPRPQGRLPVGLPTSPHPMRRSPMMSPQPHPGSPARTPQPNYAGPGGLQPPNGRAYDAGQPSPISPMPSPFLSGAPKSPNGLPARPSEPQGYPEGKMQRVRPRGPSEAAMMQPASHDLRDRNRTGGPRMNGNSPSHAPPLPPINPRRRQETSRTRTMYDSSPDRQGESQHGPPSSASTPNLLKHAEGRRGPQNFTPPDFSSRPRDNTPPFNVGPPASRMVVAPSRNPSSGHPGGMI